MSKSGLNFIFLVLLLVSSSVVFAAIVGSGNSNINLIVSSGSFVNSNCSAGSAFTGVAAGGNFICNPFVFSITQGIGLLFNPNPITQSGVISLQNATELTIGGINVRNCTGTDRVSGFFGNMTPICSSTSTGTVTSISQGEGIVNNPNPITTTGVIQLANATNTTLGGIRLANCTGNDRFSGFNASLNPICTPTAAGSGSAVEITLYEGLSSNQTPITSNATLLLRNATELTIGGTRVRNCSSGFHITGYFGNMTPICTGELNNGTVTSVDNGSGIVVNPDPITGSGLVLLANATNISIGGVMAENCTSGFHVSGWNSSLNPICSGDLVNGTVTSISEGEGIMANPNPIIAVGNILLRNATELLLGGIKVRNCSSTQGIVGWMANLTGICGDLGGAGLGIKQLTFGVGVSGNESPLLTNGTIFLKNASASEIGGILASNCTGTDKVSGVSGGGALVCTSDTGGATIKQITIYEGLLSNETPITSNATLMLANATELTNGGTKVRNCTSGFHITGYFGNMTPICTGELNNGTVTSLTGENGITLNPTTITTTGVIMGTNATPASLGVIRTVNCTTGNYFDSFATNNTPTCTAEVGDISSVQAGTGLQGGNLSGGAVLYLKNSSLSEIGGILASNCTGTDKFSGVTGGGVLTCTTDTGGSSNAIKEIKWYTPLSSNESPIISNATLMVINATTLTEGVVRVANCSSGSFISGFDSSNAPICTNTNNFLNTVSSNPYCAPNQGEACEFYDFIGGDVNSQFSTQNAPFDVYSNGIGACSSVTNTGFARRLQQLGIGMCPEGFLVFGITYKVGAEGILFKSPSSTSTSSYCTSSPEITYNCSKIINTSNIFEMSIRFSNNNLTAAGGNGDGISNVTMLFGFFQRNDTSTFSIDGFLPNKLQNVIAFYHLRNDTNWSAITMLGGNSSNQTTILPLDFNSTADITKFNVFKIVRENSTGNMLFYINSSLVANHTSFIPDWTAQAGLLIGRHSQVPTGTTDINGWLIDWIKYYHNKTTSGVFVETNPATPNSVSNIFGLQQITLFEGLSSNESPITRNATLLLNNASELLNGGVKIFNCTSGFHVSGWFGNMTPFCSGDVANGSVTSISSGEGIVVNPSPIIGIGTIMGANATTSARGIVQVANCTGTDKVSGWSAGNVPTCSSDSVGGTNYNWTLVDRLYFSKTKTNVGTSFVDVYNAAVDPEDTLINTTGTTEFRLITTVDYVSGSATPESVSLNQTSVANNKLWQFNFTADCDPCDSGWQTLPSWASGVETFIEAQINATTSGDDPVFKGYQLWLR